MISFSCCTSRSDRTVILFKVYFQDSSFHCSTTMRANRYGRDLISHPPHPLLASYCFRLTHTQILSLVKVCSHVLTIAVAWSFVALSLPLALLLSRSSAIPTFLLLFPFLSASLYFFLFSSRLLSLSLQIARVVIPFFTL